MLYEITSLDLKYLSSLELIAKYYNPKLRVYGLSYKLPETDKNIEKLKNFYPNLNIDKFNVRLELNGSSTVGIKNGYHMLTILHDPVQDSYFRSILCFDTDKKCN